MDTASIPKVFWHALSFCMVIATLGLLIIAYQSTTISLEIANTKIELSTAISETKEIKGELQLENERLQKANAMLEEKIAALTETGNGGSRTLTAEEISSLKALAAPPSAEKSNVISEDRFQALDDRIQNVQQYIKR